MRIPGLGEREGVWIAALAALALIQCAPVIASGARWGFWDWDLFETLAEAGRRSILTYGQWPAWNPWVKGGEPLSAHPLQMFVSPAFLAVLALGVVPGLKLWICVRAGAALIGGYVLGRRLGLVPLAAVVVAALFGLASTYALRVGHGHWNLQAAAYLPWVVIAGLTAAKSHSWKARAGAAIVLALLFLEGGPYVYVMGALLLLALGVAELAQRRPRAIATFAMVGVLSLGLSAVKLAPVFGLYGEGARDVAYAPADPTPGAAQHVFADFYSPEFRASAGRIVGAGWLSRDQAGDAADPHATFGINVGAYIGVLGAALAIGGAFLGGALGRAAWLVALPFFWLLLGEAAPLNLWAWLQRLPVWSSMTVPSKFTACALLAVAVAAGAGVDGAMRRFATTPGRRVFGFALVLALTLDLLWVSWPIYRYAFPLEPVAIEADTFRQVRLSPYLRSPGPEFGELPRRPGNKAHALSASFGAVRANLGVLGTYTGQPVRGFAQPDRQPGLRVMWSEGSDPAPALARWSPNELVLAVHATRDRLLVVNHNFSSGWSARSETGAALEVADFRGLLAVRVPAQATKVELRYRVPLGRFGAGVSLATLALLFTLVWRERSASQSR
jgi:hypothetical protein